VPPTVSPKTKKHDMKTEYTSGILKNDHDAKNMTTHLFQKKKKKKKKKKRKKFLKKKKKTK